MKARIRLIGPKAIAKLGVFSMLISLLILPGILEGRHAEEEPREGTVLLRLSELGIEIRREKVFDAETGRFLRNNEITSGPNTGRALTDQQVDELAQEDLQKYIEREGAIEPDFLEIVKRIATQDPSRMLPVAVWARFDAERLPPRPEAEQLERMPPEEQERFWRRFVQDVKQAINQLTRPMLLAMRDKNARNLRPSRITPTAFADMPAGEILELARHTDVVALVFDGSQQAALELDDSACTVGAGLVQLQGFDGGPVEVAVIEAPNANGNSRVDNDLNCLAVFSIMSNNTGESRHATGVAGIIASTLSGRIGVAPGANILSANMDDTDLSDIDEALEWSLDEGGDVFNMSFGTNQSPYLQIDDLEVDFFVRHYGRTVVKSAGNISNTCSVTLNVTSPGKAYNLITVGNFADQGNCDRTDDTISATSCYGDPFSPHGDRQKPEVAAPGTSITTINTGGGGGGACTTQTGGGTSFAAPHVSGTAALLIHRNNSLKFKPEAVKAIIMASAFNNVQGVRRLSEKDGVGGIDAFRADAIVENGNFKWLSLDEDDFNSAGIRDLATFTLAGNITRLKIVLSWNSVVNGVLSKIPDGLANDFDLAVYRDGTAPGNLVATSKSYDNNYETVDILNPEPGIYTIRVQVFGAILLAKLQGGHSEEVVGVAWGKQTPLIQN